ncbi:MAG: glycosyltransferase family 2 protein [Gallionella sp.]
MKKPRITVITVCYNSVGTIVDTLESIALQTYKYFEHIVVDGGSTDGTLAILREWTMHPILLVSEPDDGIYDAMNKGIALAKGEYIGMLNSDDYFAHPWVLEKIAGRFKANNLDAVFSCLDIVDPANLNRVLRKYRITTLNTFMLRIGAMPPHPTFYCKKSCYEKAGPYRTDYRIAADFEMLVRLLVKHHIAWEFIDEITVKMRPGGISSRGIKSNWVVNREIIRACTENGLYTNMFVLALKIPIRLLERVF